MKVLNNDHCVFFDVDGTLVMWEESERYNERLIIDDPYSAEVETVYVNTDHVMLLKKMSNRGKFIVVWSHGGAKWAEAVIQALDLKKYVDVCMAKVEDFVDDTPWDKWTIKNLYLKRFGSYEE